MRSGSYLFPCVWSPSADVAGRRGRRMRRRRSGRCGALAGLGVGGGGGHRRGSLLWQREGADR